jgi:hypothetical protein
MKHPKIVADTEKTTARINDFLIVVVNCEAETYGKINNADIRITPTACTPIAIINTKMELKIN